MPNNVLYSALAQARHESRCPFGDCLTHFFGDYLAPRDVAPLAAQGPVRRLRHQPTARAPSTDQNSAPDNSQRSSWIPGGWFGGFGVRPRSGWTYAAGTAQGLSATSPATFDTYGQRLE